MSSIDDFYSKLLTCQPEYMAFISFDLIAKLQAPAARNQNRGINSTGMGMPSVSHFPMTALASAAVILRTFARSGGGGQP